ncbi:vWA domain-containing protein [Guptibacillus algicola]|uniref:vWA domain-containing protein n=1 Tax=Guptibacillus algicola TaxID=225844 RepID=UPI001CD2BD11|nr:BatA and WFA domain-containing protein [Alkalihalobacillus algicola]MCA0989056.1 BatA and WFA domain-containing protein [Alkalihalobacillus algicola]
MGFIVPSFLWMLSLTAMIVVFYLFRKQFDKTQVPSTFLWNQVIEEWQASKWWRKLQQNLLFYLQLLFVILIVIALARPFVVTDKMSGETGAVVLDTSATMSAGKDETKFERAKKEVLDLIDDLGDEQSLTMVTAGAVPELIFANETDKRKMKSLVGDLSVTYEEENMTESVSLAASYIAGQQGSIYIFSDDVEENEVSDVQSQVVVRNIGEEVENLSLLTFGVKNNQATATVKNNTQESSSISVGIYSNEKKVIETKKHVVEAGESYTFRFDELPEHRYYKAHIEEDDDYAIDNTQYAFSNVDVTPEIYFAGDVSPFIKRAFTLLGYDPITLTSENGSFSYPEREDAIYVLSGVKKANWPEKGGVLLFSPVAEGSTDYHVKKKIKLETKLTGSDRPVLKYVNMEDVYLQSAYPISIDLDHIVKSGGVPVLLSGDFEGKQMMVASFDINDSDWPLHPGFPIFVQNTIQSLSKTQTTLGTYVPGHTMELPFSSSTKVAVIEDSNGTTVKELTDDWSLEVPYQPDMYTIIEERSDGFSERNFVVGIPSSEWSPQVNESFSSGEESGPAAKSGIVEWWHVFAGVGLLILLIEWEVHRRGNAI